MVAQVAPVAREIAESDPQIMGMTKDIPIFSPEGMAALDDASALMLEEADSLPLLLETSGVPNAGGVIRSFVLEHDEIFYRVFSSKPFGGFLTKVPPTSSAAAREALALPPNNQATYIQEVIVPAGTRLQRSRALPAFGRQGGAEQFELLDHIPTSNFGMPRKLE